MTSLLFGHVVDLCAVRHPQCDGRIDRARSAARGGRDEPRGEPCPGLPEGGVAAIRSSVLSGFIFAFIISFSDINLALFISGPNSTTLPVYIFNLLLFEGDPSVAAASTLQIVIVGLLIWLVQRLFQPRTLV